MTKAFVIVWVAGCTAMAWTTLSYCNDLFSPLLHSADSTSIPSLALVTPATGGLAAAPGSTTAPHAADTPSTAAPAGQLDEGPAKGGREPGKQQKVVEAEKMVEMDVPGGVTSRAGVGACNWCATLCACFLPWEQRP